ncbi:hypothetical protein ATPR_2825 [Acetobacter tropicalis NBRC 101654]|uniref:Uncharacterized protein n=1 Tax=Acetobacter tropicalis NBRC 101654 TaxID=749388 RepID=F7VHH6_9PROT|nr:hypothetical protein ATPR_2825 [Acetobacter tropicalis NBRC 101654]
MRENEVMKGGREICPLRLFYAALGRIMNNKTPDSNWRGVDCIEIKSLKCDSITSHA